jgi:alpha-glucosidase (family GH31 glycosyl hydrolase)
MEIKLEESPTNLSNNIYNRPHLKGAQINPTAPIRGDRNSSWFPFDVLQRRESTGISMYYIGVGFIDNGLFW